MLHYLHPDLLPWPVAIAADTPPLIFLVVAGYNIVAGFFSRDIYGGGFIIQAAKQTVKANVLTPRIHQAWRVSASVCECLMLFHRVLQV